MGIPFICFSSLIAIARTSTTMLSNSDKSGHTRLVPDLRGNPFSFSPLRIMFSVGLLYMVFIMLRYVPSMLIFWKVFFFYFNHKPLLNFVKSFFCIYWYYNTVFIFHILIWCITLTEFLILYNPCIPEINLTCLWYMIFLMCCWILFARILESFCIYVHELYWPVIFFYVMFVWFCYQGDGGFIEWVWKFSFFNKFLKVSKR